MSAVIVLKRHAAKNRFTTVKADKVVAAKIDRLGELKNLLPPLKTLQAEYDTLKKELVSQFSDQGDPDAELTLVGRKCSVLLSPRSLDKSVPDLAALFDKTGRKAFFTLVKPSITEIEKTLSASERADLIVVEPGDRRLKAVIPG